MFLLGGLDRPRPPYLRTRTEWFWNFTKRTRIPNNLPTNKHTYLFVFDSISVAVWFHLIAEWYPNKFGAQTTNENVCGCGLHLYNIDVYSFRIWIPDLRWYIWRKVSESLQYSDGILSNLCDPCPLLDYVRCSPNRSNERTIRQILKDPRVSFYV